MKRSQAVLVHAGVALATAGLVISTPAAVNASGLVHHDITLTADAPDLPDPFGVMQYVFEESQRQIATGFDVLSDGEFSVGMSLLAAGFANSFVYAPLASALTVFDAAIGQYPVWLSVGDYYYFELDLEAAFDRVGVLISEAFEQVSLSFEQFAAGEFNEGAASILYAFTNIVPDIPLQLMVGAASLFDGFDGMDSF